MKPRRPPSPLTPEDNFLWAHVVERTNTRWKVAARHRLTLYHGSLDADRRDADLMLHLGEHYADVRGWQQAYPGVWHSACAFQGIAIPRDLDRGHYT